MKDYRGNYYFDTRQKPIKPRTAGDGLDCSICGKASICRYSEFSYDANRAHLSRVDCLVPKTGGSNGRVIEQA